MIELEEEQELFNLMTGLFIIYLTIQIIQTKNTYWM